MISFDGQAFVCAQQYGAPSRKGSSGPFLLHYWGGSLPEIQGGKMTSSASHDTRGPQTRTTCSSESVSTRTLVHQGLYVLHRLEKLRWHQRGARS